MISKKVFVLTLVLIFVGFLFMGAVTRFYALKITPQSGDTYGLRMYDATGTTLMFGINKSGNIETMGRTTYELTQSGQTSLSVFYKSGVSVTAALMRQYNTFLIDTGQTGVTVWTQSPYGYAKSGLTVTLPAVQSDMDGHIYNFMAIPTSGTTRFVLYGTSVATTSGVTQSTYGLYNYSVGSCISVMAMYNSGVSWVIVQPAGMPTS